MVDFWDITQLVMSTDSHKKSNISIKNTGDKLAVEIQGGINTSFLTVGGYIQRVSGYFIGDILEEDSIGDKKAKH